MVDRLTNYFGAVPLETDLLHAQQMGMVGLAKLSAAVLGATTIVNGFTVTQTPSASLNIILTAGEIYQIENLEATSWSSLGPDSHSILKQGILIDPVTVGVTPPGTSGYSQVILVEVQYQDLDTQAVTLPYYNANAPLSPFSGPGNSGNQQNTFRKGIVAYQLKYGVAAPTGTQIAPTQDAGWTGIYTITVANGASTVTTGNISQVATAPWIPVTLPNVPAGVQFNSWVYANDIGTSGAFKINLTPAISSYTAGLGVIVKAANASPGACTINILSNGVLLGAKNIVHQDGSALAAGEIHVGGLFGAVYDGTNFQLSWASAVPSASSSGPTIAAHGQCYLKLNGSSLQLNPLNGNALLINGTQQAIPSSGLTLAASGLTPSTFYYIYAWMNGATMTLEASTTGHTTNTSTGVEQKSGDSTRTLVGAAYCVTGPAWADSNNQRYVISWFNRIEKFSQAQFSIARSTNSTSFTEIHTEIRSSFIQWNNDDVLYYFSASLYASGAANVGFTAVSVDGTVQPPVSATGAGTGSNVFGNGSLSGCVTLVSPEGQTHFASVVGAVSINTTTLNFVYQPSGIITIPTMQCVIKG